MWTKNIELAIESFNVFSKKRSDFKLIVAGMVDAKSKPYLKKLQSLASKNKNIRFVENPSDKKMRKLYSECFTAIFTAFNEDFGITPIEANAHGKPVIALNSGGFKESQIDNKTGLLVPSMVDKLAQKMQLLSNNEKLVIKMGKSARANSKQYSWNFFSKNIEQILKKPINEKNK